MFYKIDPDVVRRCKIFAEKCWETNKAEYTRRNMGTSSAVKAQLELDKIAEFAAMEHLVSFYLYKCSNPNMNIYKPWENTTSADLTANGMNFYVRSITDNTAHTYGISWLFKKNDNVVTKPKANDFIVFTYMDNEKIQIFKIINANLLLPLYKEPKLEYSKSSKIAIYWQDIKNLKTLGEENL